jgi:AcrR family transcriptional regulator
LLVAAREVFVDVGFHAAAMDDIAARAGVTKPVLYQHFGSKRDLYLAVLDAGVEDFIASVGEGLQSSHDNHSRVTGTIEAYLQFVSQEDAVYRLVFESDLVNVPDVRARVERANALSADLVSDLIAEDTGLSPQEATLLGYGLLGMAQTAARQWLTEPGDIERADAAQLLAALAWRGISGFPMSHPPAAAAAEGTDKAAAAAAPPADRPVQPRAKSDR